jgi:hemerythrin superfamily protein
MRWSAAHNAGELIRADHRKVEKLFSEYEALEGQSSERVSLAQQICRELDIHAQIEEELFYPAVQTSLQREGEQLVSEAIKEHQTIKDLVAQLKGMTSDEVSRDSTMQQLKQCVTHHVQEEEKEMLPKAEELLRDQLELLGSQMQHRKQQLLESTQDPHQAEMSEQHTPRT